MATDMTKHSQCMKILEYLRTHPFINTKIARELFRCERLASRINDLKCRGHKIGKNMISYKDDEGTTIRYAEYYLQEAI